MPRGKAKGAEEAAPMGLSEDHQREFDNASSRNDKKFRIKVITANRADKASVSEPHLHLSMFARAVASFYLCFFMRARHMKQRPGDVGFGEAGFDGRDEGCKGHPNQ